MPAYMSYTLLRRLSVRQDDEKTLEGQGRQQSDGQNGHLSGTSGVSGSVGVHVTQFHRPAQTNLQSTKIQVCLRFCGPIFKIHIRLLAKTRHQ